MGQLIWDAFACIGIWFTGSLIAAMFWVAFKRGAGRT